MSQTTKWKVKVLFPSGRKRTLKVEVPDIQGTALFVAIHDATFKAIKHTGWRVSKIEKVSK